MDTLPDTVLRCVFRHLRAIDLYALSKTTPRMGWLVYHHPVVIHNTPPHDLLDSLEPPTYGIGIELDDMLLAFAHIKEVIDARRHMMPLRHYGQHITKLQLIPYNLPNQSTLLRVPAIGMKMYAADYTMQLNCILDLKTLEHLELGRVDRDFVDVIPYRLVNLRKLVVLLTTKGYWCDDGLSGIVKNMAKQPRFKALPTVIPSTAVKVQLPSDKYIKRAWFVGEGTVYVRCGESTSTYKLRNGRPVELHNMGGHLAKCKLIQVADAKVELFAEIDESRPCSTATADVLTTEYQYGTSSNVWKKHGMHFINPLREMRIRSSQGAAALVGDTGNDKMIFASTASDDGVTYLDTKGYNASRAVRMDIVYPEEDTLDAEVTSYNVLTADEWGMTMWFV